MSRTKTIGLTIGSLAAGAVLATSVTGFAMAADSSPSPSPSTSQNGASGTDGATGTDRSAPGQKGMERGGIDGPRGGHRGGMLGGPHGDTLHGEVVVKAADGTISTVRTIRGTVTAVTASSITVKAEDDFTSTFAISATTEVHVGPPTDTATTSTIADVKVGDVAHVEATVAGSTATATEVHAMTAEQAAQMKSQRDQMDQQRAVGVAPHAHDAQGNDIPSSGASSSATTSGSSAA